MACVLGLRLLLCGKVDAYFSDLVSVYYIRLLKLYMGDDVFKDISGLVALAFLLRFL